MVDLRGASLALALGTAVAAVWLHRRRSRLARGPAVSATDPAARAGSQRRPPSKDPRGKRSRGRGMLTRVKMECATTTPEYALAAERIVRRGDKVLVLGGIPEALMRDLAARSRGDGGQIIHVDMQRKDGAFGAEASDVPHLRTVCGDVHDALFLLGLDVPFTLIFVDLTVITGNDLVLDQLAFAHTLCALFAPSCQTMVIKSRALSLLASCTTDANTFVAAVGKYASALAAPAPAAPPADEPAPASKRGAGPAPPPRLLSGVGTVFIGGHGVWEYRAAALAALLPTDSVLEIGCHSGASTRLVARHLRAIGGDGLVVGVDIGKSIIELARSQDNTGAVYEVADAWDTAALLRISSSFSVILVDVGGLSSHHGILEALALLRQLRSAYAPHVRLIVAKSKCMRDFPLYARVVARMWRQEADACPWHRLAEHAAVDAASRAANGGDAQPAASKVRRKGPAKPTGPPPSLTDTP